LHLRVTDRVRAIRCTPYINNQPPRKPSLIALSKTDGDSCFANQRFS
jgi:hypothetical protein